VNATPVSASLPATRPAILVVIDGLTPAMFEDAVERRTAPTLAALAEHGEYRRATTVFPSLTPVCISSLVTGAQPDVHGIPHLVWYHRSERRVVEYGSSFAALRRAGTRRAILDAIFRMNEQHLSRDAVTLYEAVEDAGLVAAAVNIICYRGRTPHLPRLPGLTRPAHGPQRFFYFNLFESDVTGAPFRVGGRHVGANDRYAAAVGRWLVTRDGFDLLVYYLPDYDFASHAAGPDAAHEALARSDDAVRALVDAAGGIDGLLERYAVVVCADHGQTKVTTPVALERAFAGVDDVVVTASNRAAMVYDLRGGRARELAGRLDAEPSVEVALFRVDGELVARRDGSEGADALEGYPDGFARAAAALRNPNAGDVLVSAAPGYEFTDLAGRHHAGGGSHGSLVAGDSEVPMLAIGMPTPARVTDVAPLLLDHLGVERPAYARALSHVG
jgi:predicted AlkP superfamily pyrophosphatase or phosphodiesterase